MSRLFEQTEINGLETANRLVRSATWEGMATQEGAVTPRLVDLMSELAVDSTWSEHTTYHPKRRIYHCM